MNGGPIGRIVTHGMFELDGGSWEVDNNIWVVGDDSQVVGDPHPRTLPRVGMLACPRTGLRPHPVRGRPRCHGGRLRPPDHPQIHLEPTRHATADSVVYTGHGDSTTIGDEIIHYDEWVIRGHVPPTSPCRPTARRSSVPQAG